MKIMQLIEESCIASSEGDSRKGLVKAKEASNKERNLIRMQEQSGLGDHHNMDLTYSVKRLAIMLTQFVLKYFVGFIYFSESIRTK